MEDVFVGVISRVWPCFLVHAEQCGSFAQTTGRKVADLPVSHELGKNILQFYSMYSLQQVTRGKGGCSFIVPMQLIEALKLLLLLTPCL